MTTEAEATAAALRWRISERSAQEAAGHLEARALAGRMFTPEELAELGELQEELAGGGATWTEIWLGQVGEILVRDAPAGQRPDLRAATDRTAFAVIDRPGTAVSIGTYDDGSNLLLLDRGVVFLLGALFNPLATAWGTAAQDERTVRRARIHQQVRLEVAARRFLPGAEGGLLRFVQKPSELSLASYLTGRALLFAMAHELGHVSLGHTGTRRLHLAGHEVASSPDDVQLEIEADRHAATVAFGDLASGPGEDVLFVHLCAARGLFTVLAAMEAETYVLPARTHPRAPERWRRLRAAVLDQGREDVLRRLDGFWRQLDLDGAWVHPLPDPDVLLAGLREVEELDLDTLPDKVCGLLALADQHFTMTEQQHRSVLDEMGEGEYERARDLLGASGSERPFGLSWQTFFEQLEPYTIIPRPPVISAAVVAWADHRRAPPGADDRSDPPA